MSLCLCNLSADTILELMAQNGAELEPAGSDLTTFSADSEMAISLLGSYFDELPKPIELLVAMQRDDDMQQKLCSPLGISAKENCTTTLTTCASRLRLAVDGIVPAPSRSWKTASTLPPSASANVDE